jgi:hypothetical protein
LVNNNQKQPIPNVQVFESQFSWADVVTATNAQLNAMAMGEPVRFRDGTLVKSSSSPTIYIMADGLTRPISSWGIFIAYGYQISRVKIVSAAYLQQYQVGEVL